MPQNADYHTSWSYPTPHTESDEDQWGDILNTLFEDELDEAVILKDTKANRPSAGTADRWFLATDESPPGLYLDDGAQWVTIWDGDADTLDGYEGSAFGALSEAETVTGSWTFSPGLTTGGDLADDAGNTVYDYSNAWVPLAILEASSLTVAGNAVSLGGSTAVSHADISNQTSSDHHTRFAASEVDSTNWSDYEIQKNGTDGTGIINFKT